MKDKRQPEPLDIIALILNAVALTPNLIIFAALLGEQIKTGWGFPTNYEMLVLAFWLCQLLTIPIVIVTAGYTVFCLIKRKFSKLFYINIAIITATLAALVLSVVFECN